MGSSRRSFVAGISAATAWALSNFASEIRANAFAHAPVALKKARILFNENPLGHLVEAHPSYSAVGDAAVEIPSSQI